MELAAGEYRVVETLSGLVLGSTRVRVLPSKTSAVTLGHHPAEISVLHVTLPAGLPPATWLELRDARGNRMFSGTLQGVGVRDGVWRVNCPMGEYLLNLTTGFDTTHEMPLRVEGGALTRRDLSEWDLR